MFRGTVGKARDVRSFCLFTAGVGRSFALESFHFTESCLADRVVQSERKRRNDFIWNLSLNSRISSYESNVTCLLE